MPQIVKDPVLGVVEFPDDATPEEMTSAMNAEAARRAPKPATAQELVEASVSSDDPMRRGAAEYALRRRMQATGIPTAPYTERDSQIFSRLKGEELRQVFGLGPKTSSVAAGLFNVGEGLIEPFIDPANPMNALLVAGRVAPRVVSGLFAADMARHTYEAASAAGEASGVGSLQEKVEGIGGLASLAAFAGLAGKHSLTPKPKVPAVTPEQVAANDAALNALDPRNAQEQMPVSLSQLQAIKENLRREADREAMLKDDMRYILSEKDRAREAAVAEGLNEAVPAEGNTPFDQYRQAVKFGLVAPDLPGAARVIVPDSVSGGRIASGGGGLPSGPKFPRSTSQVESYAEWLENRRQLESEPATAESQPAQGTPLRTVVEILRDKLDRRDMVGAVKAASKIPADARVETVNQLLGIGRRGVPISAAETILFENIFAAVDAKLNPRPQFSPRDPGLPPFMPQEPVAPKPAPVESLPKPQVLPRSETPLTGETVTEVQSRAPRLAPEGNAEEGLRRALTMRVDLYPAGGQQYSEAVISGRPAQSTQPDLSALTSGKSLWHETSLENSFGVYQGLRRPLKQSWTRFFASDNPDLALGQAGKGVLFEINPERVNGWRRAKPGTTDSTGFEYSIDRSIFKSVKSITFANRRQLEAFEKRFPNSIDYPNAEAVERGIKVVPKTQVSETAASAPELALGFSGNTKLVQAAAPETGATVDWATLVEKSDLSINQKLRMHRDVQSRVNAGVSESDFLAAMWKAPKGRPLNEGHRRWNRTASTIADAIYDERETTPATVRPASPSETPAPVAEATEKGIEKVGRAPDPTPIQRAPDIIERLEAMKSKPGGETMSVVFPGLDPASGRALMNTGIDIAIRAIKGGRSLNTAVSMGMAHLRSKANGFDEAAALREILDALSAIPPVPSKPETEGIRKRFADESAEGEKMRKLAARMATNRELPKETRADVRDNPRSFYTPQTMPEVKARVEGMSEAELQAVPVDIRDGPDNVWTAAKARQLQLALEKGDREGARSVIEESAEKGTALGQLINQYKMFKGATPDGVSWMLNELLLRGGRDPLTPELDAQLRGLAETEFAAREAVGAADQAYKSAPAPERAARATEARKGFQAAADATQAFVDAHQPKASWQDLITAIYKGNIMTVLTQPTNFAGNVYSITARQGNRTIGSGLDYITSLLSGAERTSVARPAGGLQDAMRAALESRDEMKHILTTGARPRDLVKVGGAVNLRPFHALAQAFGREALPTRDGRVTLSDRAKAIVEGTLGMNAAAQFRMLGAVDAPFYESAKARLIGEQLEIEERTLSVVERRLAQVAPELFFGRKTAERIEHEAERAVFRDPGALSKIASSVRAQGAFARATLDILVPFVNTPANIAWEVFTFTPLGAAIDLGIALHTKDRRRAEHAIGKAIVGGTLFAAGQYLFSNGLIGPMYEDSDDSQKERMAADMGGVPRGHLNRSGLDRLARGGNPAHRRGDRTVNILSNPSVPTTLMLAAANWEHWKEKVPASAQNDIAQQLASTSATTGRAMLEQNFLRTTAMFIDALRGRGEDKLVDSLFRSALAVVIPNTVSPFSRATRLNTVSVRDDETTKRFVNIVKDRLGVFGADKELLPRRDFWGMPIKQTPEGANPWLYHLFDVTRSQTVPGDRVNMEIFRLWRETGDSTPIPSIPSRGEMQAYGIAFDALTPVQYDSLAEKVGRNRRVLAEKIVESPGWGSLDNGDQIGLLEKIYEFGMEEAKTGFILENVRELKPAEKPAGFKAR